MAKLTESQKRMLMGIAIVEMLVGVALLILSLAGISSIPIFLPLLLLLSAVIVFAVGQRA